MLFFVGFKTDKNIDSIDFVSHNIIVLGRRGVCNDKNLIKVLTGVRRSGKTVLLQQIQEYLLENGKISNQIVYLNFESKKNV